MQKFSRHRLRAGVRVLPYRSLQRSFNLDNLHLAGRDLSSRFVVASRGHQAALVAGQHAPKDRHRTFLGLRMRTAEADQSLWTMLSSGYGGRITLVSGMQPAEELQKLRWYGQGAICSPLNRKKICQHSMPKMWSTLAALARATHPTLQRLVK